MPPELKKVCILKTFLSGLNATMSDNPSLSKSTPATWRSPALEEKSDRRKERTSLKILCPLFSSIPTIVITDSGPLRAIATSSFPSPFISTTSILLID